jgi:hypothetical protein
MNSEGERARLQQQGIDSLGWITRNIDHFNPWQKGRLTDSGIKALAELAVLYMYLERWRLRPLNEYLSLISILPTWRNFISRHCEKAAYAETVRKRPAQAYYLLLPYLMLRSGGYHSPYYEETMKRLQRWRYLMPTEVVPYRRLDQQYIFWKSGYLNREPNWYRLYKRTVLNNRCRLAYIDKDITYSITHTLFYLTDLGDHPIPLRPAEIKHIAEVLECLLFHYWRLADWDLVCELLINLNCLDARDSAFYSGASAAFRKACRRDGAIPASQMCEEKICSTPSSEPGETIFQLCYHTTLLNVLYCATALNQLDENGINLTQRPEKC